MTKITPSPHAPIKDPPEAAFSDKLQAIQKISTVLASSLDFQRVLNQICRYAVELFSVDHSGLVLFDENLESGSVCGEYPGSMRTEGGRIPVRGVPAEEKVVFRQQPLICPDLEQAKEEFGPVYAILREHNIRSILIVPIIYQEHVLGSFSLDAVGHVHAFSQEEIELCGLFASQVAVAVANARMHEEISRRNRRLEKLQKIGVRLNQKLNIADTLKAACEGVVELLEVDHSSIVLFDPRLSQGVVRAEHPEIGTLGKVIPVRGVPFEEQLVQGQRPLILNAIGGDATLGLAGDILSEYKIQSTILVPIVSEDGKTLGSFGVDSIRATRQFTPEEADLCSLLAVQIAVAFQNARLFEEIERHKQLLSTLVHAATNIRAERGTERLLSESVSTAAKMVSCPSGCLFVNRPNLGQMELAAVFGLPTELLGVRLSHDQGLAGWVARNGRSRLVTDYDHWEERELLFEAQQFVTAVGIPLVKQSNVDAVLLILEPDAGRVFTQIDLDVLERFATQAAITLHTSQLMGKEKRILSQIEILNKINEYIPGIEDIETDIDKILHLILTGVTAGYGLGFNRAVLFLLDEERGVMEGRLGIGHLEESRAWQDWAEDKAKGFYQYLELLEAGDIPLTPVGERVRSLRFASRTPAFQAFIEQICRERCTLVTEKDQEKIPLSVRQAFEPAFPLVVAPLIVPGKVLGLLVADNKFTRTPITSEDQEALLAFVNAAAVVIHNAQLYYQVKSAGEKLRSFYEANNALVSSRDPSEVLNDIVEQARKAAGADGVSMILIGPEGNVRHLVSAGIDQPSDMGQIIRPNGISRQVMFTCQPFQIEDVRNHLEVINPALLERHIQAALCMPILLGGECIGVIWFHYRRVRTFPPYEIEAVQLFVNQAALTYDSAARIQEMDRLRLETESLLSRLARIYDGLQVVARSTALGNLKGTLDAIVRALREALKCDTVSLYIYDESLGHITQVFGDGYLRWENLAQPEQLGPDSTVWSVLNLEAPYFRYTENTPADPLLNGKFVEQEKIQTTLAIQLRCEETHVGVLFLNSRQAWHLGQDELNNALSFADLAAVAIRNAQLYEVTRRNAHTMQALYETGKAITRPIDLNELLREIQQQAWELTQVHSQPARFSHLGMLKGSRLEFIARYPAVVPPASELHSVDLENSTKIGITGRAVKSGQSQLVRDVRLDEDYIQFDPDIRSELAVPVKMEGQIIGIIDLEHNEVGAFNESDQQALEHLADQAAIAIHNAQQYQELQKTRNRLAGQTSLSWVGMVSSAWRHAIDNDTVVIQEQVKLLRDQLSGPGPLNREKVNERLEMIERLAMQIKAKPMTPPLSSEEGVRLVRINELVRERVKQLWKNEPYRSVSLTTDYQLDDSLTVRASSEWLKRALDLIIDNAIKATRGLTEQHVTVATRLHGERAEIAFSDNGPGIPPELLPYIGQTQIPKKEGEAGLGLGLVMVQTIVQTYGGELSVEASSPQGTTMLISMPLEKGSDLAEQPARESGRSFLLVGSQADTPFIKLLREALVPIGSLELAAEGETQRSDYDVVILDATEIQDVSEQISHWHRVHPRAITVVATAAPSWTRAREAISSGAEQYIQKDMSQEELRAFFQNLLRASPAG